MFERLSKSQKANKFIMCKTDVKTFQQQIFPECLQRVKEAAATECSGFWEREFYWEICRWPLADTTASEHKEC